MSSILIKQIEGKFDVTLLSHKNRFYRVNRKYNTYITTAGQGWEGVIFNQNHFKICNELCSMPWNSSNFWRPISYMFEINDNGSWIWIDVLTLKYFTLRPTAIIPFQIRIQNNSNLKYTIKYRRIRNMSLNIDFGIYCFIESTNWYRFTSNQKKTKHHYVVSAVYSLNLNGM